MILDTLLSVVMCFFLLLCILNGRNYLASKRRYEERKAEERAEKEIMEENIKRIHSLLNIMKDLYDPVVMINITPKVNYILTKMDKKSLKDQNKTLERLHAALYETKTRLDQNREVREIIAPLNNMMK